MKRVVFIVVVFLFSFFTTSLWGNVNLFQKKYNPLYISEDEFNSGQIYAKLKGDAHLRLTESFFWFIGRALDNECYANPPGMFCNYGFLARMMDPGYQGQGKAAGPLRTDNYQPCTYKTSLGNCKGIDVPSADYWYVLPDNGSLHGSVSGADYWIFPNGWWEAEYGNSGNTNSPYYDPAYANYVNNGGDTDGNGKGCEDGSSEDDKRCFIVYGSDDNNETGTDCDGPNCQWCKSESEVYGGGPWRGDYCYPGDDQAVYVDWWHLDWCNLPNGYPEPNGTVDCHDLNNPWRIGRTIPHDYYYNGYDFNNAVIRSYPEPYPHVQPTSRDFTGKIKTWDGTDLVEFGFCMNNTSNCKRDIDGDGDYDEQGESDIPPNSILLTLAIPHVYLEIGVHDTSLSTEHTGRVQMDWLRIYSALGFYLWDDTSDTASDCATNGDNNACDDGMNDPDALDLKVSVYYVQFVNFKSDANGSLGSIVSSILNSLQGTLESTIQKTLNNSIKKALGGAFPMDLNNLLGNPWHFGRALFNVGIYGGTDFGNDGTYDFDIQNQPGYSESITWAASAEIDGQHKDPKRIWYDYVATDPTLSSGWWMADSLHKVADMSMDMAVEPILFNANCSWDDDLQSPESTDFYGVCTLYNPDGTVDEDQQFDMNGSPATSATAHGTTDYFGPPIKEKACTPPANVHLDTSYFTDPVYLNYSGDSTDNTIGDWDTITYDRNHDGTIEADEDNQRYDMNLEINENFFTQFLYVAYASGALCFDIAPYDTETSSPTPYRNFLKISNWIPFFPILNSIAKQDSYLEIKVIPDSIPIARTGMGTYDNSVGSVDYDETTGNRGSGTFDILMYLPALDFQFWFQDKNGVWKRLITLRWNLLAGFDIEFFHGCHPLDHPVGLEPFNCTDPKAPGYIPGYFSIYGELQPPSLLDYYGIQPVQIVESEIDVNTDKLHNMISNILGLLMSAYIQFRVDTRLGGVFMGTSFDVHYIGPDGFDSNGRGHYLGIYLSLYGKLDLGSLMGGLTGAPPTRLFPDTYIVTPTNDHIFETQSLDSSESKTLGFINGKDVVIKYGAISGVDPKYVWYTYRIDNGLWHPPVKTRKVKFTNLPDGRHQVEVAALNYVGKYAFMDVDPAKLSFVVDTTPPQLSLGYDKHAGVVQFNAYDNISDKSDIKFSWSIDGKGFTPWVSQDFIKVDYLQNGVHRIVVKAKDEAGNVSQEGIIVDVENNEKAFGCSNAPIPDMSFVLLALLLSFAAFKIRERN